MANYTATKSVSVYNTVEEAVAGLETKLEAVPVTRLNLKADIIRLPNNQYAAYIIYTDEA